MRYTLSGFNQGMILLLKKRDEKGKLISLNRCDLDVLNWLLDIWFSESRNSFARHINPEDGLEYINIRYEYVSQEFPLLFADKQSAYLSFRRLSFLRLINHYHHKQGGSYSCYRPVEDVISLIRSRGVQIADRELNINVKTLYKELLHPFDFEYTKEDVEVLNRYPGIDQNTINLLLSRFSDAVIEETKPSSSEEFPDGIHHEIHRCDKYIEFWNSQENLPCHKKGTKIWQNSRTYLEAILNRRPFTLNYEYKQRNGITDEKINSTVTDEMIYTAIERFNYLKSADLPGVKDKLPKSMDVFLYNSISGSSVFWSLVGDDRQPAPLKIECVNPDLAKIFRSTFYKGHSINEIEKDWLHRGVNFLEKRKKEYFEFMRGRGLGSFIPVSENRFNDIFIMFWQREQDRKRFSPENLSSPYHWKLFLTWAKDTDPKWDFFPGPEQVAKWNARLNEKIA